jgi:hypothetical protein
MVDLAQWEKENSRENGEANKSIIETIGKESAPSLLDIAPRFKDILNDHAYGWWSPPDENR